MMVPSASVVGSTDMHDISLDRALWSKSIALNMGRRAKRQAWLYS